MALDCVNRQQLWPANQFLARRYLPLERDSRKLFGVWAFVNAEIYLLHVEGGRSGSPRGRNENLSRPKIFAEWFPATHKILTNMAGDGSPLPRGLTLASTLNAATHLHAVLPLSHGKVDISTVRLSHEKVDNFRTNSYCTIRASSLRKLADFSRQNSIFPAKKIRTARALQTSPRGRRP